MSGTISSKRGVASSVVVGVVLAIATVPAAAEEWDLSAKLLAADGAADDYFGWSVALDGDRALIGAQYDDDNGSGSGSAYVFEKRGGLWMEVAKVTAADGAAGGRFGCSVALDGDRALIGARWAYGADVFSGSAYVFEKWGGLWGQTAKLTADDGALGDEFGYAVALDGDRALIGAWGDKDNGDWSGSAYVFEKQGGIWVQLGKLLASDGATWDQFGQSLALDGDRALIGALGGDDNRSNEGAAYVFEKQDAVWVQLAKLLAADGAADDQFGISVGLDGDRALIGAYTDDDNGSSSGSAYVFEKQGGVWVQTAKLTADDGAGGDQFGISVALDADRALIGAHWAYGADDRSGSAYVFEEWGGVWVQTAKLTADDGAAMDFFAGSVALDGERALIGAYGDDDDGSSSGSAYVFDVACAGDLDGDGDTDDSDLGVLLDDWDCTGGDCPGDLDNDGDTDQSDLGILLADWGCGT